MKLFVSLLFCFCLTGCVSFGVSYTNQDVVGHSVTLAVTKSGKEPVGIFVNAVKRPSK